MNALHVLIRSQKPEPPRRSPRLDPHAPLSALGQFQRLTLPRELFFYVSRDELDMQVWALLRLHFSAYFWCLLNEI